MADIDFKNGVNVDSAYTDGHKVRLIAIPDGSLELPISATSDSGYVVDANGKKHRVLLATFLNGTPDYKLSPTADSAYMTVDGQKVKVRLVAKLTNSLELPSSANADQGYALGDDSKKHRVTLVATPTGTLELPNSETDDSAYVVDGNGKKHKVRLFFLASGGAKEVIIKGVAPLSLPDAIANSLSYVKAFGGTEQNGTPTPNAPVDIVTNNGVLKYSANMANVNAQTALIGYYISATGVVTADANNWIYQDYIPVKPNTTYTLSFDINVYYVTISEYSTPDDSGFIIRNAGGSGSNTSLTITTGATTNYIRFGTNIDRAVVTLEEVLAIKWQLNMGNIMPYQPYVSANGGVYTDGTVETINAHGKNLFDKTTYIAGKYYNSSGNIVENPNYGMSGFIPIKSGQTFALSGRTPSGIAIFNTSQVWQQQVTGQTFTAPYDGYFVVSVAAGQQDTLQVELGSTATTYEPYYNGGTATAEILLKVGDYQDVQSIIDGVVTRNVGIKVLDGTENWVFSTTWLNYMYSLEVSDLYAEASSVASNRKSPYCTHFGRSENWLGGSARANMVQAYQPTTGDAILGLGYGTPSTANLAAFKSWLAAQYAAGTPVIVIYPLATPTTESVTGQTLQVQAGDNVLEITQAGISGLELEAKYQAAVSLTIQEVQDANLDPNVEVTIN